MHPCLSCGACCAYFRVSFHWLEAEIIDGQLGVPQHLTEDLNQQYRCMKGTNQPTNIRCIALAGELGKDSYCSIYALRPSPCRSFEASYENGQPNERCDKARMAHGMAPLTSLDWVSAPLIPLHPENDDDPQPGRPLRPAA